MLQTQYAYGPFGNTTPSGPASSNPFQYTGRENDGTGLLYYRARYYNPTLQRFISEDPLGFKARDTNLYAYVGNAPVNQSDPGGTSAFWVHYSETINAAQRAGYSLSGALALTAAVMNADKDSQGTDPISSHFHAMGGIRKDGQPETCAEAYLGAVNSLRVSLMNLNSGSLPFAIHEIEDSYSGSHLYAPWSGEMHASHAQADTIYHEDAAQAVESLLSALKNNQPIAEPQHYLARPPAGCK